MASRTTAAVLSIPLILLLCACGDDENANKGPKKEDYEAAIKELADPIGVISIYRPHLEVPKSQGKYDPRPKARDNTRRQWEAANQIRLAATEGRQRGKSPVVKLLSDALANVARACTEAKEPNKVAKCKEAIVALDVELEKQGKAAADAGATGKMPRIHKDSINEKARKKFEPYQKAIGPTPSEVKLLKGLEDKKAVVFELIAICETAHAEQQEVWKSFEGIDEGIRKVAVLHQQAINVICLSLKRTEALKVELSNCEDEKNKEKPECVLACTKGINKIKEGVPCAAHETLPEHQKKMCEDVELPKGPGDNPDAGKTP